MGTAKGGRWTKKNKWEVGMGDVHGRQWGSRSNETSKVGGMRLKSRRSNHFPLALPTHVSAKDFDSRYSRENPLIPASTRDIPFKFLADPQMCDQSALTLTSTDVSDNLNGAVTLSLLNRANFIDHVTGSRATLGALTNGSINFAAELQKQTVRHYGPALVKLLKDFQDWVRAHPYRLTTILSGITLFALAWAAPAILGAIGFNAIGPVAGSLAAAWQASIGSVAAGSAFAFLQSAAMGGAAMSVFAGIGALGGGAAVAVVLAPSKEIIGGWVGKMKGFFRKRKDD